MIKKRRDLENHELIDLRNSNSTINERISIKTNADENDGVTIEQYHLLPKYGKGFINHFNSEDIDITISRYQLHNDLVFSQSSRKEVIQISFLLKGEKIIYVGSGKEIFFENRESYLADLKSFNGYVRILSGKLFKEVKIRLPLSFLLDHGFMNDCDLKKLTDENLILPITDELFSILENIERKDITGTANRIYLKAKVFELLAIQMENYKNKEVNAIKWSDDKTLKKLYLIKQVIKSNLHKNLSLIQLASEAGINGNTLNREFIRVFGCSVHEFSVTEKMNQAKHILENTEKMVYQISEEVGYKNSTHFTAAFKRRFGITPIQYRNRL